MSVFILAAAAAATLALSAPPPPRLGVIDPAQLPVLLPAGPGTAAAGKKEVVPNVFPDPLAIPRGEWHPLDWPAPQGDITHLAIPEGGLTDGPYPAIDRRFDVLAGDATPPDPVVAVGKNGFVVLVNRLIAMYDKNGVLTSGPFSLAEFFGASSDQNPFDPLAVYDPFSDRFIVAAAGGSFSSTSSVIWVAFSQTGDAAGLYNKYAIPAWRGQSGRWADYPSIGLDRNAVYFTANMYQLNWYNNVTLFIYDKEDGYAGRPLDNKHLIDVRTASNGSAYRLRPAYVPEAVTGNEYYLAHMDQSGGDRINLFRLKGPRFTAPILTASSVATPSTYFGVGDARQTGPGTGYDSMGTSVWNAWYRGGALWLAHAISSNGNIAAWVHRLRVSETPATREQTYQLEVAGQDFPFPYVVPDAEDDDFALFSTASSATVSPAGKYWNVGADGTVRAAEAISTSAFPNDSYRHGDYFAVGTDPLDRNRFWTVSHSFPLSSSYNNVVSSVLFEPVAPPSPPPVPDGKTIAGQQVRVARAAAAGDVTVTYDAVTCSAPGHHLVWYDLASISGYTVAARTCAIGIGGGWTGPAPAGDVGVVVVSDDSLTVEGSHGLDSAGAERPSVVAGCGITTKTTTGTCP